jgi:hypothetical protein
MTGGREEDDEEDFEEEMEDDSLTFETQHKKKLGTEEVNLLCFNFLGSHGRCKFRYKFHRSI